MRRKTKKSSSRRGKKRSGKREITFKRPTTLRQYHAMAPRDQESWDSLAHAISDARRGVPLRSALKDLGISLNTALVLGRPALRKKNGKYVATKTDRLLRVLPILKRKGKQVIATRDSRQASLIGSYWAAVQRYLQTGDDSALLKFKKVRIADVELNRQASAGVLSFESLYAGGSR